MHPSNEVKAVSVAAGLLRSALNVLTFASDSIAYGMRVSIERELRRLGPDHKSEAFAPDQLRAFVAAQHGEDSAADICDGKEPPKVVGLTPAQEIDQLRQQLGAVSKERDGLKSQVAQHAAQQAWATPQPGPPPGSAALFEAPPPLDVPDGAAPPAPDAAPTDDPHPFSFKVDPPL